MSKDARKLGSGGHARFRLELPGVGPGTLQVERVTGHQALEGMDRLQVRVSGLPGSGIEAWPGQLASLTLGQGGAAQRIHGVIAEMARVQGDGEGAGAALVTLRSPLFPLSGAHGRRVYRQCSVVTIAREILEQTLPGGVSVRVGVDGSVAEPPFLVQGASDDLAFLLRVLARDGCFPLLRDAGGRAEVCLVDRLAQAGLDTVTLTWHPSGGPMATTPAIFWDVVRGFQLQPGRVRVSGFDPALPDHCADATAGDPAQAEPCPPLGLHGVSAGGEAAHAGWAEGVRQAMTAQRSRIQARVGIPLVPGMRVVLRGHPQAGVDGDYWVGRVEHEGDQAAAIHGGGGADGVDYLGRVELLPTDTGYRPRPVPAPAVPGVAVARVAGGDPQRAELDEYGAYRIRLQEEDETNESNSAPPPGPPVWAVQPSAGPDHGLHLPLLPGTRVAVAGLHGDLEQPVILGALSGQDQPGPVDGDHSHQHLLKTAAGQRLLLDDRPGRERAELAVDEAARLTLHGGEDDPGAILEAPEGRLELVSGGEQRVRSGGDQKLEVAGAYRLEVAEACRLETENGALCCSAGEALRLESGDGDLHQEAPDGEIALQAGGAFSAEAGADVRLVAREGDGEWHCEAGALRLEAAGDCTLVSTGGGRIQIGDGLGVRIEDSGEIHLEGRRIEIRAEELVLSADRIEEGR